tara:strand:+ start:1421 stop:2512 length:1092 start_codon:yes stop_codon:yes gene_type:complete
MKVKLHNSHVLIGAKASTEHALNLPLVPSEESLFTINDKQYVNYFCSSLKSNSSDSYANEDSLNENKVTRCINLIKKLNLEVEQLGQKLPEDIPVFWLLPEFTESFDNSIDASNTAINNENTLAYFAKKLQQALPLLFSHPQSQLFPFGRAAFPVALAAAKTLFDSENEKTILLIAVDTLYHDVANLIANNMLVSASSEQGVIPSEGVIITQISPTDTGISIDFIQNSVAPSKQQNLAVTQLFTDSVHYFAENTENNEQQTASDRLSHLYLPGNGDETLQNSWLDAYYQLAGYVDDKTSICQSALFTGELGCVTGLYNFLHIVNGYKTKVIQGNVLHLEVSNSLHQGVILYSYNNQIHGVDHD